MRPRGTKFHPGDTVQMGAYIQQQPGIVSFVLKCATFQDDNEDTPPTLKENAMLCKTKIEKQVGGFFASTPSLLPPYCTRTARRRVAMGTRVRRAANAPWCTGALETPERHVQVAELATGIAPAAAAGRATRNWFS